MDYLPFFSNDPTLLDNAWSFLTWPLGILIHPIRSFASLPFLSLLVIPAFSSYTTMLNFLFFYMTWAILISSNPPLLVELVGSLAVRFVFFVCPSAGFLAFDSFFSDLAKSLKEHGSDALPTGPRQGGPRGNWWRIVAVSIVNILMAVAIQVGIDALLVKVFQSKGALKITTNVPMPWNVIQDLLFGLFLREMATFVLHRYVLHNDSNDTSVVKARPSKQSGRKRGAQGASPSSQPLLGFLSSPRLKKLHADWQHKIASPWSFVAHYDHPLPYLVHVFLPTYVPAVFLRMHLLTFNIYLTIVSLEETFSYSGYNVLPTAFILGGMARRQERHLMSGGRGNYGCFGLADFFCGTTLGDQDFVHDLVDEADEKDLPQKAKGDAKALKNMARKQLTRHDEDDDDEDDDSPYLEEHSGNDDNSEDEDGEEDHERHDERVSANTSTKSQPRRRGNRPPPKKLEVRGGNGRKRS